MSCTNIEWNKLKNMYLLGYGVSANENISHNTIPKDQTSD